MLVTKRFSRNIDVRDAVSLYTNLEENLMGLLRVYVEGRCLNQSLVKRVTRITSFGDCVVGIDGDPTVASIFVEFEAEAAIAPQDSILPQMPVTLRKNNDIIYCSSPDMDICVHRADKHPATAVAKVGDKIDIRVVKTSYDIGASKFAVIGVPYAPTAPMSYYRVNTADYRGSAYINHLLTKLVRILSDPKYSVANTERSRAFMQVDETMPKDDRDNVLIHSADRGTITVNMPQNAVRYMYRPITAEPIIICSTTEPNSKYYRPIPAGVTTNTEAAFGALLCLLINHITSLGLGLGLGSDA